MNLPKEFIQKYQNLLGADAKDFLASFSKESINGFRVEEQRNHTDFNNYQKIQGLNNGYYGKISGSSIESLAGVVYSQEPSAMTVGQVLNPDLDDRVLDLCAAPGGKSTQLASLMGNKGFLLSNDPNLKRAKILAENISRMGYCNTVVSSEKPERLSQRFPQFFSKILVDAPCSGEGMFRKNPDAIKYWDLDYPEFCAKRQKEILSEAFKMLEPGGVLVYSTCTFSPEEDENVVSYFLNKDPKLSLLSIDHLPGFSNGEPNFGDGNKALSKCVRLYPHLFKGEGQFIAKFKLSGVHNDDSLKKIKVKNIPQSGIDFLNSTFNEKFSNILERQDSLYNIDPEINELVSDLRIIKRGVKIGDLRKGRLIPHQDIFQAKGIFCKNIIDCSESDFTKYLHGDSIDSPSDLTFGKKWVALSYQGYIFGFGHLVEGKIKNFYPKNLRN